MKNSFKKIVELAIGGEQDKAIELLHKRLRRMQKKLFRFVHKVEPGEEPLFAACVEEILQVTDEAFSCEDKVIMDQYLEVMKCEKRNRTK